MYGIANDSDIVTDNAGNTTDAMTSVRIVQSGGEGVMEHHEDNVWGSDVKLEEGLLFLYLCRLALLATDALLRIRWRLSLVR